MKDVVVPVNNVLLGKCSGYFTQKKKTKLNILKLDGSYIDVARRVGIHRTESDRAILVRITTHRA